MTNNRPRSYRPDDPYIFVSYDRDDQKIIYPEIEKLQEQNFNIWYDDGISSIASDFSEKIATAIENCTLFAVCITKHSITSDFIRNEIHFAREHKKPLAIIFYDDVKLPNDLQLILGRHQHILKHQLKWDEYALTMHNAFNDALRKEGKRPPVPPPPPPPIINKKIMYMILAAIVIILLLILFWKNDWHILKSSPENMALVPSGKFIRGTSLKTAENLVKEFGLFGSSLEILLANKHEKAFLPDFYIDKFTVTNDQYKKFIEKSGYPKPSHWTDGGQPFASEISRHPVVNISYTDALSYCRWLKKRLPTSMEWEKAARGADGRLYPWGNTYDVSYCNTVESKNNGSVPVDSYVKGISPYGIYNMTGNVYEWTSTGDHDTKVIRGGSWRSTCEIYGLSSFVKKAEVDYKGDETGFRCAKDAE